MKQKQFIFTALGLALALSIQSMAPVQAQTVTPDPASDLCQYGEDVGGGSVTSSIDCGDNNVFGRNAVAIGNGNDVDSSSSAVGQNNKVGYESHVQGNDNEIQSGIVVNGNRNIANSSGTNIQGSDNQVTTGNVVGNSNLLTGYVNKNVTGNGNSINSTTGSFTPYETVNSTGDDNYLDGIRINNYGSGNYISGTSTLKGSNNVYGSNNAISGKDNILIGNNGSIGFKNNIQGINNRSVGIGEGVEIECDNGVAVGSGSKCDEDQSFSVGNSETGVRRRITNVTAGINNNDAVIMEQINYFTRSIDPNSSFVNGVFVAPQITFQSGITYTNIKEPLLNLDSRISALENNPSSGTPGPAGAAGKSAYQSALDGGFVGTESQWVTSLKGDTGAQGAAGANGTNGIDGVNGVNGTNGIDGKSAYQSAVDGGFTGNESDWVASLKGDKGDKGDTGAPGSGNGSQGPAGADGKSAYQSAVDGGFVGSESDWVASLNGTDGKDGTNGNDGVDGAIGADGKDGAAGTDGKDGVDGKDGAQGSKGDKGDKGDTGLAGVDGTDGANGNDGTNGSGSDELAVHYDDADKNTATLRSSTNGTTRLSGVANGRIEQGSTDAVNGGQIWELNDRWEQRYKETNRNIEKLGAQSAALSMMASSASYLPVGKVAIQSGVGMYGNEAAVAVGFKVRTSEKSSLSGGFSFANGKAMGGFGFSYILD